MTKLLLIMGLLVVAATPASAKQAVCQSPFVFESKPALTLTDLAHLVLKESFENPLMENRYLTVESYDDEDHPFRNHRMGVAVVYASTGDLGQPGIGGRLWSKVTTDLDKDQMESLDRSNGAVNVVFVTRKPFGKCGLQTFKIRFDDKGNITANGILLGNMQ